jgi:dTDP-4-dehydrorhamnose 3,5-epimerase
MPFLFEPQAIPDVVLITPKPFTDDRGTFIEAYKRTAFLQAGIPDVFVQDNSSTSRLGVLRGLHYQNPPYAQSKLVRCVVGHIWDVAVDIRQGSPTFGQWVGAHLTQDNFAMLYVPEGFAHGFLVLSQTATVHYKTGGEYHQPSDAGVLWSDPALAIDWPKVPGLQGGFVVSAKDAQLPTLAQARNGFAQPARLPTMTKA